MIYNMGCQKTVAIVALLNIFSLNLALGDDFYDALKAKNKYDSKTASQVRKDTVEDARAKQMNAQTANNPDFKPLPKTPYGAPLSDAQFKKAKDAEKDFTPDADDKIPEKPAGYVEKDEDAPEGPTKPVTPAHKTADHAAPAPKDVYNSGAVKVTSEDPDEVKFEEEEKPVRVNKPAPTPTKKK